MSTFECVLGRRMQYLVLLLSAVFSTMCQVYGRCVPTIGVQNIYPMMAHGAASVFVADLDNDGDMDVLSASTYDDKIAWYENLDANGTFGVQHVITTKASGAQSVYAADLDNDGDMDVLSASYNDDKIAWYENKDGNGAFGAQNVITTLADGAVWVYAADLNNDGDMDVLSASFVDDKIAWYENLDGNGTFGLQKLITTLANGALSLHASDLDNDGDMDVLSASRFDNKIAWYENMDGNGAFGLQNVITTLAKGARSVHAADLDNDGDMDVLSASGAALTDPPIISAKIAWYENVDGNGSYGGQNVIKSLSSYAYTVYPADLDNDGDLDVASASDGKIAWYENTDGDGTFGVQKVIMTVGTGAVSVYAIDLNNDDDTDVLSVSASENQIAWYENTDGVFGVQKGITTEESNTQNVITLLANGARSVYAADLDNDGDMDVLSASFTTSPGPPSPTPPMSNGKIAWYENTDGDATFGGQQLITTLAEYAVSVHVADLDNDGDMDVLSASSNDGEIAWYENVEGNGTFGVQNVITPHANGAQWVYAADLDNDGDMDVMSASSDDDKIAWYENMDGNGTFGPQSVITTQANNAYSVYAADLDGDGDMDVLSASYNDDKIAWYENTDGNGTFGQQQVITTLADGARSVFAADIDEDGDMDVLSASFRDDKIAWYENLDGDGTFGVQNVITMVAKGANSVYASDLDNDGDVDVLSAASSNGKITWYENMDGNGTFGGQKVITTLTDYATSVYAVDLDQDGDLDVLSTSYSDDKIAWYENTCDYLPTASPTSVPTSPTVSPTLAPTAPTLAPTLIPTAPTFSPTSEPTAPTFSPTFSPTTTTTSPSMAPTTTPTASPTILSTTMPTTVPVAPQTTTSTETSSKDTQTLWSSTTVYPTAFTMLPFQNHVWR